MEELRKEFGQDFLYNVVRQNDVKQNKINDINDIKNSQVKILTDFKCVSETDSMTMKSLVHILNKSKGKILIECFEKGCLENPNNDYSYSYISLLVHNDFFESTTEIIENDQSITMYRINAMWENDQRKKEKEYYKKYAQTEIIKKMKEDRKVRNIIVKFDKHDPKNAYYFDLMFHYPFETLSELPNNIADELINNYFCCKIRHNKPGDHSNWIISTITQIN